jgi:hypothetical protein
MPTKNTIIIGLLAQFACGQRADAEEEEGCHAVRHEVFPALQTEFRCNAGDGCCEDQQEHVVQGVTDIEQQACGQGVHLVIIRQVHAAVAWQRALKERTGGEELADGAVHRVIQDPHAVG